MGNVYQWFLKRGGITTQVSSDPIGYTLNGATSGDQIWCELTTNCPCRSGSTAISKVINIVASAIVKSISITSEPISPICIGTNVTFTAHQVNYSTPNYQWKLNGGNVGLNSEYYTTSNLSNGDSITCVCTENGGGDSNTSNTIEMTVNSVTPFVSIEFGVWRIVDGVDVWTLQDNPICQGDRVQFRTNQITNGGNNPYFIWWKGNGIVSYGFNQTWYDDYGLNDGDGVYVQMTSYAECAHPTNVDSNLISMDVNPLITPTVTVSPTISTSCYGYNVTFTAIPTNGGTPIYNWYVNNTLNQTGSNANYIYIPTNGDIVHCEMISNLSCAINPAISNNVQNNVLPNITPTVTVSANMEQPFCILNWGYITFYATIIGNVVSPNYQWQRCVYDVWDMNYPYIVGNKVMYNYLFYICISNVQGPGLNPDTHPLIWQINTNPDYVNVGSNKDYYFPYGDGGGILENGTRIRVILTTSEQCVTSPVTSTEFIVYVQESLTPSVYIVKSPTGQVPCGTLLTFTAYPTNGGSSPTYQWKVNGNIVGTGTIYSSSNLKNGDGIFCIMTSNASCADPILVGSNGIYVYMTYNTPSLQISLSVNPVSPPAGTTTLSVSNQYPIISENTVSDSYKWYQLDGNGDPTILLGTTPYNTPHYGPFSPTPWATQRYQCKFTSYHTCFSSFLPFDVWSNVVTLYTIFQNPFQINVWPTNGDTGCGLFLTLPNDGITDNYLVGPPPGNTGSLIVFPYANNSSQGNQQQNRISSFYIGRYLCYFYSESHQPGIYRYNIEIFNEFGNKINQPDPWVTSIIAGSNAGLYKWFEAFYILVFDDYTYTIQYSTPGGTLRKVAPPYGSPYVWYDGTKFYCFDLSVGNNITTWFWVFEFSINNYAMFREYLNGSWGDWKYSTHTQNPIISFYQSGITLRARLNLNGISDNSGIYWFNVP